MSVGIIGSGEIDVNNIDDISIIDDEYIIGDINLNVYSEYVDIIEGIEFILFWWEQQFNK